MRSSCCLVAALLVATNLVAQGAASPPRLVAAELGPAPWNVASGGIAAVEVTIDEAGSVTSADLVQDVAPFGGMLSEALPRWRFEPARKDGRAVPSRVLVLGLFRPPGINFPAPTNPRYKDTTAPEELPWPTSVAVPPYPANALGSGKVILEADISDGGQVTGTRVLTTPTAFDGAAVESLRQWKFRPASRGNRDVSSRAFFVFSFVGAIIGQEAIIERLLIGLLANGNLLVEGLPGLAKTRAVKSLARNLEAGLSRIQFTPDLLPSDITGTEVYHQDAGKSEFRFEQGPIFNNLILADEINRAPAKVQAALLEAMEERQVTVAGKTHPLPPLFLVMATQNPIEQEGTYPLPEAQMDRFLMHVLIGYPDEQAEGEIVRLVRSEEQPVPQKDGVPAPTPVPQQAVFDARRVIHAVQVAPAIEKYIVDLVFATRYPERYNQDLRKWIQIGASPRGGLALDKCSRAYAWLQGRDHVTPDDVRAVVHYCLRHRLMLSYEASASGLTAQKVVSEIVKVVAVA